MFSVFSPNFVVEDVVDEFSRCGERWVARLESYTEKKRYIRCRTICVDVGNQMPCAKIDLIAAFPRRRTAQHDVDGIT